MVFLTELGDMRRFRNRKKVGAFLGVVPSSNESGENNDRKGHITRQGPARVRKVLCQAAWARIAFDKEEQKVHARIVEKNSKKASAIRRMQVDGREPRLTMLFPGRFTMFLSSHIFQK